MSAKNNAMLAGSWLVFILIFGGGIIGLLFLAVWITRTSDSNNDKKKQIKSNGEVVKSIPKTDCGCGGGKKIEPEKKKQA